MMFHIIDAVIASSYLLDAYWFDESYSTVIANTDIGLINRNLFLAKTTKDLINRNFDYSKQFLDYAGGY